MDGNTEKVVELFLFLPIFFLFGMAKYFELLPLGWRRFVALIFFWEAGAVLFSGPSSNSLRYDAALQEAEQLVPLFDVQVEGQNDCSIAWTPRLIRLIHLAVHRWRESRYYPFRKESIMAPHAKRILEMPWLLDRLEQLRRATLRPTPPPFHLTSHCCIVVGPPVGGCAMLMMILSRQWILSRQCSG